MFELYIEGRRPIQVSSLKNASLVTTQFRCGIGDAEVTPPFGETLIWDGTSKFVSFHNFVNLNSEELSAAA